MEEFGVGVTFFTCPELASLFPISGPLLNEQR
jgi:hypothetical protein